MRQAAFEDLGTPLFSQQFVTLDLETTGGSPDNDSITEIGALKSVGGEITGTFQTLVRPDHAIRPYVEFLTGISDVMVAPAPPITEVLPSLTEFLRGSILVAHNARFDATFLAAAFKRHGYDVPFQKSICTLRLARWLMKGETRNLKLDSLAASLGVATHPCHRAFPDARATHEIFHRLLELAGPLGVLTVEDLSAFYQGGAEARHHEGRACCAHSADDRGLQVPGSKRQDPLCRQGQEPSRPCSFLLLRRRKTENR